MSASIRRNLAVAALAATAAAAFDPTSKTNVAVYWGQGPNQDSLAYTCSNPEIDIVNIGFVNAFPSNSPGNYPGTNFGNACGSATYTVNGVSTLLQSSCTQIASDITTCQQQYGKKVLLSLGGAAPLNYYNANDTAAVDFADFLWGAFGPQTTAWTNAGKPRPFGTAVVDGFDFDIESYMSPPPNDASGNAISDYQSRGYMAMIQELKNKLFPQDTSKSYYISGAPVCGLPDSHLSFAIQYAWFDFIFVQFYNNAACSGRAAVNYAAGDSFTHWTQAPSLNPNAKILFGLPASPFAAASTSDYLTQAEVQGLVQRFSGSARWGGIMLWEATYAQYNVACNQNYASWMKNILNAVMSGNTVDTDLSKCNPSATALPAPGPTQSGIPATCNKYQMANNDPGRSCSIFASRAGITPQQLYQWNPVLGSNGENCGTQFLGNEYYCVGVSTQSAAPAPGPTQSGIINTCTGYLMANSGGTCPVFANRAGITTAQLYQWNPVLGANGENCATSFWANEYYCVKVSGSSASSTTMAPSPTAAPAPGPTQSGIINTCNKYLMANNDPGRSCSIFASRAGITTQQLYQWNPVLGNNGQNCASQFNGNTYYCVGVRSSSKRDLSAYGAAPLTTAAPAYGAPPAYGASSASTSLSVFGEEAFSSLSAYLVSVATISTEYTGLSTSASSTEFSSSSTLTSSTESPVETTSAAPVYPSAYGGASSSTSSSSSESSAATSSSSSTAIILSSYAAASSSSSSSTSSSSSSSTANAATETSTSSTASASASSYASSSSASSSSTIVSPVTESSLPSSLSSPIIATPYNSANQSASAYSSVASSSASSSASAAITSTVISSSVSSSSANAETSSSSSLSSYSNATTSAVSTYSSSALSTSASSASSSSSVEFAVTGGSSSSSAFSYAASTGSVASAETSSALSSPSEAFSYAPITSSATSAAPTTVTTYSTSVATITSCLPGADCSAHPESQTTIYSTSTLSITKTLYLTSSVTEASSTGITTAPESASATPSTITTYSTSVATITSCLPGADCGAHPESQTTIYSTSTLSITKTLYLTSSVTEAPPTTASPETLTSYSTTVEAVTSCIAGADCATNPESKTTLYSTLTLALTKTIYPTSYVTLASASSSDSELTTTLSSTSTTYLTETLTLTRASGSASSVIATTPVSSESAPAYTAPSGYVPSSASEASPATSSSAASIPPASYASSSQAAPVSYAPSAQVAASSFTAPSGYASPSADTSSGSQAAAATTSSAPVQVSTFYVIPVQSMPATAPYGAVNGTAAATGSAAPSGTGAVKPPTYSGALITPYTGAAWKKSISLSFAAVVVGATLFVM